MRPPEQQPYDQTYQRGPYEDNYSPRKSDGIFYGIAMIVFVVAAIVLFFVFQDLILVIFSAIVILIGIMLLLVFVFNVLSLPYYLLRKDPPDNVHYHQNYSIKNVKGNRGQRSQPPPPEQDTRDMDYEDYSFPKR
jgi:hypothetical protein